MPTPPFIEPGPRRPLVVRAAPWLLLICVCVGWNALMAIQRRMDFGNAWLVGWDDNLYLAWGRSLAVDGDWDFANDLAFPASLTSLPDTSRVFQAALRRDERTKTGRVPNKYACGVGLLALPLLLATRLGLEVLAYTGFTGPPDPFSSFYAFAFTLSGALWGIGGLVAARRLLRRDYAPRVASLAVLVGALGLSLGYYIWFEPTMAHATGFAVATVHLLCVRAWVDRALAATPEPVAGWGRWAFLMGLSLGVACLVRYTSVVLALVPIVLVRTARASCPPDGGPGPAVIRRSAGLAAAGCLIGFLPQIIAWKVVYGAVIAYTYTGEMLLPVPVHVLGVLFGPRNGLFTWTPLAVFAIVGLVRGRHDRPWCRAGLVTLAATAWIYGGWQMPWLGNSFGMRGFVDVSFFLLLGVAELIARPRGLPVRFPFRRVPPVLLGVAVVWTLHLMVCYRAQIQPPGERLALGPIMTDWGRWGRQFYVDTGLRTLTDP